MIPVRHGILTYSRRRLNHAFPLQPLLLVSRSLQTKSFENDKQRPSKTKAYAGTALTLGLLSLTLYWALSPSAPTSTSTGPSTLDQRRFHPFAIISKEPVSSSSSIYTLRPSLPPPTDADPYAPLWARGIWSVEFKQPQLQIARSYTPLPPTVTEQPGAPGDLRFLIRREQHGEVSGYLARLRIGAVVEIRGPKVEYEVPHGVSEVVFLAGGTGIAPALQMAYTLLEKRNGERINVRILWANRRREECVGRRRAVKRSWWSWGRTNTAKDTDSVPPNRIVKELQGLEKRFEGRVRVDYMVDEEGSFIGKSDILKVTGGSGIGSVKSNEGAEAAKPGTKLLLISGPEGFVDFYAGSRELENVKLGQGCLGGLLGGLGLNNWTVVKL
jgi:cytochrome-b5 reductase